MGEKITLLKKTARLAGLLYLIVIIAIYGHRYLSSKIFVSGDLDATANNILANEFLYRIEIVISISSITIFFFMVSVLYKLLRPVSEHQAKLMAALVMVQIPIAIILGVFKITSLMILKGEGFKTLAPEQLQDMAMLFLRIYGYGILTLEMLWGLWLIPFGQLVYRSRFIPRMLGVLLIVAGTGYILDSFTFILFPGYRHFTQLPAFMLSELGEISIMLWLLIKGVKDYVLITVISETKTTLRSSVGKMKEYID